MQSEPRDQEKNISGAVPQIGSKHYRAWVGRADYYDVVGALQFQLLTMFGMRETSSLLDIGCGSLRGGRFAILYLEAGGYCGMEPDEHAWAITEGLQVHFGSDYIERKRPTFLHDGNFTLTKFQRRFDYLMAQSIFSHASRGQIDRCLGEAAKVMHGRSIFLATYFAGEADYAEDAWVYPGITRFRPETFSALCAVHGLRCWQVDWPHPSGQSWVAITPQERELDIPFILRGGNFRTESVG
ncbi:MAG TPA: class I SAM-dependent methyltransferase [Dongiaceae bacterium]|jgi:hypothetical protein|nr:class I SAM-dependent methyltransferase [Dongiaceae bacterium]